MEGSFKLGRLPKETAFGLTELERAAVANLIRNHLRETRFPFSDANAPLRAVLAKLDPAGEPPKPKPRPRRKNSCAPR